MVDEDVRRASHDLEQFRMKADKPVRGIATLPTTTTGYGQGGREVPIQKGEADNPECYCKILYYQDDSLPHYFLRVDNRGFISDPIGLLTDANNNPHRGFSETRGKPTWSFRKVTKYVFEQYLRYLQTRNKALLRLCERSLQDEAKA